MILVAWLIMTACQKSSNPGEKKKSHTQNLESNGSQLKQQIQQPTDTESVAFDKISKCVEPNFKRKRLPNGEKAYISDATSNIGLLQEGSLFPIERFLESMKITAREIHFAEISPELTNKVSILVIPTDGINASYCSAGDYERLKSYVRNGGTLLVFTQPTEKSYSNLMEGVEAVGYQDDKTHNFIEVSMVDMHPMLEGIPIKSFIMAFDGHFTKYPQNVKVYLKRDKFNQPVTIGYPLGKGTIIATTSFTPEDFDRGYATEDNIIFFREILNYFESRMELPKVKAGQDVKIKIKLTNHDKESTATAAEVEIYDPDRAFRRYYQNFAIDLSPGASTFIEFIYHTCPSAPAGIWHITYGLLAKMEQVLTSEMDPDGVKVIDDAVLQPPRDALDGRFMVIPK